MFLGTFQNFTQSTAVLYSSAKPQKKIDHDDIVLTTKVATIPIQTDIAKVLQNEVSIQTTRPAVSRKQPELPWRMTPAEADSNSLVKHYLMLSKIRLTCKFNRTSHLLSIVTQKLSLQLLWSSHRWLDMLWLQRHLISAHS